MDRAIINQSSSNEIVFTEIIIFVPFGVTIYCPGTRRKSLLLFYTLHLAADDNNIIVFKRIYMVVEGLSM